MMNHKRTGGYLALEVACFLFFMAIYFFSGSNDAGSTISESNVKAAQNEVAQIGSAVSHYKYDTGSYPTDLGDLSKDGKDLGYDGYGPWIAVIKKDPWGNDYKLQTETNGFVVYCTENGEKTNSSGENVDSGVIGYHGL